MDGRPSRTAMMSAVVRGAHRLEHDPPWVLDDQLALPLVGPPWRAILQLGDDQSPEAKSQTIAGFVTRARYVEDLVLAERPAQYVVLGAGLDSFAWRRPDLLRTTKVFEVDHPATQQWKRDRAKILALPEDPNHVFVPVDFEVESLEEELAAAGFDLNRPAIFSWIAVSWYLTAEAIRSNLEWVASRPAGSELLMSYALPYDSVDDVGRALLDFIMPVTSDSGEPFQTFFEAAEIEAHVAACGLKIVEHPTRQQLRDRYFPGRADHLIPYSIERLLRAEVG